MISERVFLAFDTGRGLAYAQASGWDRAYLLWTFRNFRGVPHKILNDRQRTLVETLYTAASTQLSRALHPDAVIGTVEDFRPAFPATVQAPGTADGLVSNSLARKLENALTRKLVYPDCPDSARGKVTLLAVVRSDGAVSQVTVLTGNRLLATIAARAIRQWRYQPFSGGAQRLERETRISVAFISNDVVAVSFPDAAPVSR